MICIVNTVRQTERHNAINLDFRLVSVLMCGFLILFRVESKFRNVCIFVQRLAIALNSSQTGKFQIRIMNKIDHRNFDNFLDTTR